MASSKTKKKKGKGTGSKYDSYVSGRLRFFRKMLKVAQTQLADDVGISYQQIQKYENDGNRIAVGKLWQISQALGVHVSVFFEGLPDKSNRKTYSALSERDHKYGSLLDMFESIDDQSLKNLAIMKCFEITEAIHKKVEEGRTECRKRS